MWCRSRRAESWIIRLNEEFQQHISSMFVTLTYNDEHLPMDNGIPVVCKHDVQLYVRYLRRLGLKFKYFIVSEYGPTTFRPHYHLILFGVGVDSLEHLVTTWSKGFVSAFAVSGGCINYVSRYTLIHSDLPDYLLTPERKPFMLCSKGIGKAFCDNKETQKFHQSTLTTTYDDNGYTKPLPRYYKEKLFTSDQRENFTQEWREKSRVSRLAVKKLLETQEGVAELTRLRNKRNIRYSDYVKKVKQEFTKKAKI